MRQNKGILRRRLASFVESGADRFDPVRFRYIASLARRCVGQRVSVARRIEQKALMALEDYVLRYEKEREKTKDIVDRISSEYPDAADRVRWLFEHGDFKGVRRLRQRLHHNSHQRAVAVLTQQVVQAGAQASDDQVQLSFDEILRRQEAKVVQSFDPSPESEGAVSNAHRHVVPRSFHLFKEVWAEQYANVLVTHAIEERPENPGPLNGQMLATRSLSAMRNLSPGYLNRFVTYIETLLWLQQADKAHGHRTTQR